MTNINLVSVQEKERKYLLDVISVYVILQGKKSLCKKMKTVNAARNEIFTQLWMLVRPKDGSIIAYLNETTAKKYTHHDTL